LFNYQIRIMKTAGLLFLYFGFIAHVVRAQDCHFVSCSFLPALQVEKASFSPAAASAAAPSASMRLRKPAFVPDARSPHGKWGIGTDSPLSMLQIGTGDISNTPVPVNFHSIYTSDTGSGVVLNGLFRTNRTDSTSSSIQGVEGYTLTSNASGSVRLAMGTLGNIEHKGAGSLLESRSVQAGGVLSGKGNVRDWIAFYAQPVSITGTGSIINAYGLYIDDYQSGRGSIRHRWGVYQHDTSAKNYFAGTLATNGYRMKIRSVDSSLTLNAHDEFMAVNASKKPVRIILPSAIGSEGQLITIKKTDSSAHPVTIATQSSQTIDGSPSYPLETAWQTLTLVSDGANWLIRSK
jgi:hypothetical protein